MSSMSAILLGQLKEKANGRQISSEQKESTSNQEDCGSRLRGTESYYPADNKAIL